MKVSYGEGVVTHTGPESCGVVRKGSVEALTGVRAGRVSRPRKKLPPGCRRCKGERKATPTVSIWRETGGPCAVEDPGHVRKHLAREPGDPLPARASGPCREVQGRTPTMNGPRKSDRAVVPPKSPNKAASAVAQGVEGRALAEGNLHEQNALRTPCREGALSALERVRQAARKDRTMRFTVLHHVYSLDTLRKAYFSLKKEAAAGVDGETWRHYGEALEEHLQELSGRLKRGAYRAKPVRRVYIAKDGGGQRPLGVTALEDKLVQRATVEVLNAIYETDFLGFSYGFRPGRSQHDCLDALYVGLLTRPVNWVLDVDIRGFFDSIDHRWLVKFVEHRIADRRIVRLIQKWLKCSKARSHSSGCESHRQNRPGTVVVISSDEKGDRLVGSLEVKASMARVTAGQIRAGGEQLDRLQQMRTRKPRNFWPAGSGLQGTRECQAFFNYGKGPCWCCKTGPVRH